MPATKKPSKRQPKLTPKQRKLIELMPLVEDGKITQKEALLRAGYKESSAHQQSSVLGGLRTNTKMQEALEKVGFTEDYLAKGIVEGAAATEATKKVVEDEDGNFSTEERADYRTRGIYYKLGAELLDAFPAKKSIEAQVGVEALLDQADEATDYAEWGDEK